MITEDEMRNMRMARPPMQQTGEVKNTVPQPDQPEWLLAMRGIFDEQGHHMTDMMTGLNSRINSLEDVLVMSASRAQQRMRDLDHSLRQDFANQNGKQEEEFGSELQRLENIDNMQRQTPSGSSTMDLRAVKERIAKLAFGDKMPHTAGN